MSERKTIVIVGPCYNEAGNIEELYSRCTKVMEKFPQYDYRFLFADNNSTDGTRDIIRNLAEKDSKVTAIFNANNYGHIRSPFNALLAAEGDAVVTMCTDLQDPPELLAEFIQEWENGYKVVLGVRSDTNCSIVMEMIRKFYYFLLSKFAPNENLIHCFTGFGLYDKCFMDALRKFKEPYPYFRGLVSEIGFNRKEIKFVQPERKRGITKNNFMTLYDMAMTGFVNHTKLPLRLAAMSGFVIALFCFIATFVYLIIKLLFWDTFQLGLAPLILGMFFLGAIQLIFIGIIGEYIGAIWTQVRNRPLVIEEERINFPEEKSKE